MKSYRQFDMKNEIFKNFPYHHSNNRSTRSRFDCLFPSEKNRSGPKSDTIRSTLNSEAAQRRSDTQIGTGQWKQKVSASDSILRKHDPKLFRSNISNYV